MPSPAWWKEKNWEALQYPVYWACSSEHDTHLHMLSNPRRAGAPVWHTLAHALQPQKGSRPAVSAKGCSLLLPPGTPTAAFSGAHLITFLWIQQSCTSINGSPSASLLSPKWRPAQDQWSRSIVSENPELRSKELWLAFQPFCFWDRSWGRP